MFDEALVERKIRIIQNRMDAARTIARQAANSKSSRTKENLQDVVVLLNEALTNLAELKKYLEELKDA